MKPISECKTVAELLEDPKRWTQCGEDAVTRDGQPAHVESDAACAFCVWGAIVKVYNVSEDSMDAAVRKLKNFSSLGEDDMFSELFSWNDSPKTTHEEMLAAVKAAGI
jgi:hypothetical protein